MYKKTVKAIHLDNGSYLDIDKLVDPHYGLRVGIQGPTITEVKGLLQVTA